MQQKHHSSPIFWYLDISSEADSLSGQQYASNSLLSEPTSSEMIELEQNQTE